MADEPRYEDWIAHRRAAAPSGDLTDRVMAAVESEDRQPTWRKERRRIVDRMNESQPARWAACVAALLVGSFPFFVVAYAAKLIVF